MSTEAAGIIPEWTLGDRLRKARQLTGLTTTQFGKAIGISQKSVSDAENDNVRPRRITLLAYAMRTGVPLEWLETGKAPDPDGPGAQLRAREDSNPQPSDPRSHLTLLRHTTYPRELVAA